MHNLIIVSFAASSILAAPLAASPETQSPKAPKASSTKTADGQICKWIERSGTHAKQRICLSKEGWQKIDNGQD